MDTTWNLVKTFFVNKGVADTVLFGVVCFAICEYLLFGALILVTFFNVLTNKDFTTSTWRTVASLLGYVVLRSLFIPFYISGILIDTEVTLTWLPTLAKIGTITLAIWWNVIMLLPTLTIWYCRAKYGIGNENRIDADAEDVENAIPDYKFIVILPVYKEQLELLIDGVYSILYSNYNKRLIELHVSFDSDNSEQQVELYDAFIDHFDLVNESNKVTISVNINQGTIMHIHRFQHAGKRLTQAKTFHFIQKYTSHLDPELLHRTIVLFTDSDNYMYDNALANLAHNFTRNEEKVAFAGYMTCMSSGLKGLNPLRWIQDAEYVGGEINRGIDVLMGTVNCLPGGFTAVRYSSLLIVAPTYFSKLSDSNITDFHRNYLGEDRYFTHLMHQSFPLHSLGFSPSARAKTDPPTSICALVKQRRRWLLGAISNECYMLSDSVVGARYPFLLTFKLLQMAWKGTTLGQIVISWIAIRYWSTTNLSTSVLPFVYSVGIPFGINWFMVAITGISIRHYKVILVYPIMHVITAIIAFVTDVYTLCSWKQRSWGGIRSSGSGGTSRAKHLSTYSITHDFVNQGQRDVVYSNPDGQLSGLKGNRKSVYYNTNVQVI